MPAESSSSQQERFIRTPDSKDVLLGRGSYCREHSGTKHFHELCRENAQEYQATNKQEPKSILAYKIINAINDAGGRFLYPVKLEDAKKKGFNDEEYDGRLWLELQCDDVLRKTKQSLRDTAVKGELGSTSSKSSPHVEGLHIPDFVTSSSHLSVPTPREEEVNHWETLEIMPETQTSSGFIPTKAVHPSDIPSPRRSEKHTLDPMEYDTSASMTNRASLHRIMDQDESTGAVRCFESEECDEKETQTSSECKSIKAVPPNDIPSPRRSEKHSLDPMQYETSASMTNTPSPHRIMDQDESNEDNEKAHTSNELEAASHLYSLLSLEDAPKFTAEDFQQEQQSVTQEERVAELTDVFGIVTHGATKRQKQPNDTLNIVDATLEDMKHEIDCLPDDKKIALLEAQVKADPSEFSDERLELFLWREDKDAAKAAMRLATYWEERRNLFGPEKYLQRMTLDEAMCDDLVALQSGVFSLLPRLDSSGRCILYRNFAHDSREGYTRESLQRAFWYLLEVMLQQKSGIVGEFVYVVREKPLTLWDYDRSFDERAFYYEASCIPVRVSALHVCCIPRLNNLLITPIYLVMVGRRIRIRTRIHEVPDDKILGVLENYGILPDMLPTEMGGNIQLDKDEWIAERRAAELT